MTHSAPERYLRLGLQVGRHVDGMVDAYFGPPALAAAVEAEPPVDPRELVSAAEALLDELEDGWLRDQVVGLRTYAAVLAGESGSYADEVGVLRRAADPHRRSRLRSRARAARRAASRRRLAGRAPRALGGLDPRPHRARRARSGSGDRGGARTDTCPARTAGGRKRRPGDRPRQILDGVL